MEEEFDDFLKHGMAQTIDKKQLLEVDILLLLLSVITIVVSDFSIIVSAVSILILTLCSVLTYSKQEVNGKKIFLVYGLWSVSLCGIFALLGISIVMIITEKKYFFLFYGMLLIVYIMIFILYTGIIMYLIKKGAYKAAKKTNGRISITLFGVFGILTARILTNNISYQNILQMASICCFLFSFLALLGVFNLIKYYCLKKRSL